jgi:ABC-type glutathione transport system ATPase component
MLCLAMLQDVETEQGVTQALEGAGRGVTSLVIAHRLSTVRRADLIVVVASGKVVEQGTHEQLMQRQGGVYWSLVSGAESRGQDSWEDDGEDDEEQDVQEEGKQPPMAHELAPTA